MPKEVVGFFFYGEEAFRLLALTKKKAVTEVDHQAQTWTAQKGYLVSFSQFHVGRSQSKPRADR